MGLAKEYIYITHTHGQQSDDGQREGGREQGGGRQKGGGKWGTSVISVNNKNKGIPLKEHRHSIEKSKLYSINKIDLKDY